MIKSDGSQTNPQNAIAVIVIGPDTETDQCVVLNAPFDDLPFCLIHCRC